MEITYIFTMISLLIVITFIELNNEIIVDKNTTIYYE